ncbi:MAG: glutamate synthase subunit beta [Bacteroidota bacterium]
MGKPSGFLEFDRELPATKAPELRKRDYKEFYEAFSEDKLRQQASRCMDCGVPFCHHGCPLGNYIPEFNDAVYEQDWDRAYEVLTRTNNFPEFTGRICPAPCEGSCVLGINHPPVSIELIEKSIAERAFEQAMVSPKVPPMRSGKRVAIVGSGPAGMAAAEQLNLAGHEVVVYERDQYPGGLLRYGIPDFKLEKSVVERRIAIMEEAGIAFRCGVEVGKDLTHEDLQRDYDAVLLCTGATVPRDMPITGRNLEGIHYAMDYLTQVNRQVSGEELNPDKELLNAAGKHVIVIGGGDTGSDCIGTANRQGAKSITQITWGPKPPLERSPENPWPETPATLQTTSSHEEGCDRDWNVLSKAFIGDESGKIKALRVVKIRWKPGRTGYEEVPGSEIDLPCNLAFLAVGFKHPEHQGLLANLSVELGPRGQVATKAWATNVPGVFAAGDNRRGQSLVVWAISEGREAARAMDEYLMGSTQLPSKKVSSLAL